MSWKSSAFLYMFPSSSRPLCSASYPGNQAASESAFGWQDPPWTGLNDSRAARQQTRPALLLTILQNILPASTHIGGTLSFFQKEKSPRKKWKLLCSGEKVVFTISGIGYSYEKFNLTSTSHHAPKPIPGGSRI